MQFSALPQKFFGIKRMIFIFFGMLFLGIGIFLLWNTRQTLSRHTKTTGTVVEHIPSRGSRGSVTYSPVVEFKLPDGTVKQFTTSLSSNVFVPAVGETVPIYYNPADPAQGNINNFSYTYGVGILFVAFGIIFVVITLLARANKSGNNPLDLLQKAQHDPELANALKTIAEKMNK